MRLNDLYAGSPRVLLVHAHAQRSRILGIDRKTLSRRGSLEGPPDERALRWIRSAEGRLTSHKAS